MHGARSLSPDVALIGLGANLGDGAATLEAALDALHGLPACAILQVSGLYRSAPVDATGPDYWNAVAALSCHLAPETLLTHLQRIEKAHGRERPLGVLNAPRTLDLDLLLFGSLRMQARRLVLPHPRMHMRAFVLVPLAEIWPDWTLPDGEPVWLAAQRLQQIGQRVEYVRPLLPRPVLPPT